MRVFSRSIGKAALGVALVAFLGGAATAQDNKPDYVGKIVDIDGPQLKTNRLKEDKWYQAYQTMPTFFKERLATDDKTSATISFAVGGRAVIAPGSKVEVLNKEVLKLKSGTVWAKFDKDKLAGQGKKFEIETAGGVMGIEGTEFIVVTNPDGTTELVMVEGTVDINGQKVTGGKKTKFGKDQALDVVEYAAYNTPSSALRDLAFNQIGDENTRRVLRPIVNRALWYVPGRYRWGRAFYGRNFWYARRALRFVRDPETALRNEANREIARRTGLGGMIPKKKPPHPVQAIAWSGSAPKITWERPNRKKGKIKNYTVVVAEDSQMENVVWYGKTKGTKTEIQYPSYGPALDGGKSYYLAVTPVNGEGEPVTHKEKYLSGKATLAAAPHSPTYSKVVGLQVDAASGPPKVTWTPVNDAIGYKVDIKSGTGATVYSGEVESGNTLEYPIHARALAAGDYQVSVEAFDSGGLKMAESSPSTFASAGWGAVGLDGDPREEASLTAPATSLVSALQQLDKAR